MSSMILSPSGRPCASGITSTSSSVLGLSSSVSRDLGGRFCGRAHGIERCGPSTDGLWSRIPRYALRATRDAVLGPCGRHASLPLVPSGPQCAMITVDHYAAGTRCDMGQAFADPREDGCCVAQRARLSRGVGQGSGNQGSITRVNEAELLDVSVRDGKGVSI
jgi:hypothetical protein